MTFRDHDKARHRIRAGFDLVPLVTVMLNLIIFFILSSTFVVQSSIQIQTPVAEGSTRQFEAKDLSVTLQFGEGGPDGEGRIYVNADEMLTWDALSERLADEIHQRPSARVLIRPDTRIATGRLVRVLGIANKVGVRYYAIATEPPRPGE